MTEDVVRGTRHMAPRRPFFLLLGVIILIVLIAATCAAVRRSTAGESHALITVRLPECDLTPETQSDGTCRFAGSGIQQTGMVGQPAMPCQSVTALLPPDTDLATVEAAMTGYRWAEIDGEWEVPPVAHLVTGDSGGPSAASPGEGTLMDGKDVRVYEENALFPVNPIRSIDTQVMHEWKTVQILYAPFAYNPIEKKIFALSGGTISITFERDALGNSGANADPADAAAIQEMTVNFAQAAGEYGAYAASADNGRYVIITTRAIEGASGNLMDFVASKEARGFAVQVVTEGTWGGGTGDTAANNIRTWLKNNYVALHIHYVLLIGNPDPTSGDVPMKMCYPQVADPSKSECPTDFYYAELTSNWNADADSRYGEFDDDFGGYPPRAAEVSVGRIPCYGDISNLDHTLSKIIAYENAPADSTSWRANALLCMKPSDNETPGYQLGEEIKDSVLVPNDWTYYRVYDSDYGLSPDPETTPCTITNVTNAWRASDFGAVVWWTHGSSTSASYVMNLTNAATLDDTHPGFAFQCSCSNGTPEASNNLGYTLLLNGCISTVCASRDSWYQERQTSFAGTATNAGMAYEYARRLIADGMYAGDALNDLRYDVSVGQQQQLWMNYLGFNLYGCPALGLTTSTPEQAAPSTVTYYAQNVTTSSARLRANLTSLGEASTVTASFQWGATSGGPYTETTTEVRSAAGTFYFDLSGLDPGTTYYYRARVSGWSTTYGDEKSFTTLFTLPSVSTSSATSIASSSARLNGSLSSLGTAGSVSVSFVWGTTSGLYDNETTSELKTSTGTFFFNLSGLAPQTTYYYRAKAMGHGTSQFGTEKSFTTLIAPPTVGTQDPTEVNNTSARLNGDLSSLGSASTVSVSFQWGTSSGNYGHETTGEVRVAIGAFYSDLSGLATGTTYYYRAKADGDGNPVYGQEKSFTAEIRPPSLTTADASNIGTTSATLNAQLASKGTADNVTLWFQWGTEPGAYDHETASEAKTSTGAFRFDLTGLASGATYYYRAAGSGQGNTVYGLEKSFTLFPEPRIGGITPGSGSVGQSLAVSILGSHLSGAMSVSFGSDIVVSSFQVVSDLQITARIKIACSAAPGSGSVSVTTQGGTALLDQGFAIIQSSAVQPQNVAPSDRSEVTTLPPVLVSSPFSSTCTERTHAASQWQVTTATGEYSSPVFDSGTDNADLTSTTLPIDIMGSQGRYWWRVRHQDDLGTWSDWSAETSFTLPSFLKAALGGPAEIRVVDSMDRVTGSVGGQAQEEIPYSRISDGVIVLASPTGSHRYRVVGTADAPYTLVVTSLAGDRLLTFRATGIPISAQEVHEYTIDWDSLSQGAKGVTVRIDSDGDGAFDKTAALEADIDGRDFVSATHLGRGTPIWVWVLVGMAALLIVGSAPLALLAIRRRNQTSAAR